MLVLRHGERPAKHPLPREVANRRMFRMPVIRAAEEHPVFLSHAPRESNMHQ